MTSSQTERRSARKSHKDLQGKKFGRLLVISRLSDRITPNGTRKYIYSCLCDCGSQVEVTSEALLSSSCSSCGCLRREKASIPRPRLRTHGKTGTKEYKLFDSAKQRAKKRGLEFSITLEDIVIPEYCPVLGIKLDTSNSRTRPNSPSLDRRDSSRGYTKDNIWVVSAKLNSAKSDLSLEQLEKLVQLLKS